MKRRRDISRKHAAANFRRIDLPRSGGLLPSPSPPEHPGIHPLPGPAAGPSHTTPPPPSRTAPLSPHPPNLHVFCSPFQFHAFSLYVVLPFSFSRVGAFPTTALRALDDVLPPL